MIFSILSGFRLISESDFSHAAMLKCRHEVRIRIVATVNLLMFEFLWRYQQILYNQSDEAKFSGGIITGGHFRFLGRGCDPATPDRPKRPTAGPGQHSPDEITYPGSSVSFQVCACRVLFDESVIITIVSRHQSH